MMQVPISFSIANGINLIAWIVGTPLVYFAIRDFVSEDSRKGLKVMIVGGVLFGLLQELGEVIYLNLEAVPQIHPALLITQWSIGPLLFMIGAIMFSRSLSNKLEDIEGGDM